MRNITMKSFEHRYYSERHEMTRYEKQSLSLVRSYKMAEDRLECFVIDDV